MKRKAAEMEAQAHAALDPTRKGKPRLRGDEHEAHDKRHIKVRTWRSPRGLFPFAWRFPSLPSCLRFCVLPLFCVFVSKPWADCFCLEDSGHPFVIFVCVRA